MHHPSPSAITYPSSPQPYYLPHSPTTHLTALRPGHDLRHTALPPAPTLLHPALLPTSLPYDPPHCPTTCTRPTPALLHPALLPTSLPLHLHTTYPTTRLSIPDPTTLPMCTLHPYLLLRSHRLHLLSHTPYTRATLHTSLPISPTDVPCHPYIL